MTKLILKFEDRVLREVALGEEPVTIGRLPDNTLVIDNPAVSGHHARVLCQANQYVLEDLQSLNGTFVNEQRIIRHALRNGDLVQVGKHRLVFHHTGKEEPAPAGVAEPASPPLPPVQDLGGTVFLDTKAQKDLMAKLAAQGQAQRAAGPAGKPQAATAHPPTPPADAAPAPTPKPVPPPSAAPVAAVPPAAAPASAAPPASASSAQAPPGVSAPAAAPSASLLVLSGSTDRPEYGLEAQTSLIGKSDQAVVKLKGWFKPDVAAAVTRKGAGFVLTPLGEKVQVNHQPVTKPHTLQDGDIVEVSGVKLQFRLKG